jgi:hypothetical protein
MFAQSLLQLGCQTCYIGVIGLVAAFMALLGGYVVTSRKRRQPAPALRGGFQLNRPTKVDEVQLAAEIEARWK